MTKVFRYILRYFSYNELTKEVHIAPLVVFRILFGLALTISAARFLYLGWLDDQYIKPVFHFTYYGFDWVKVPPAGVLYVMYLLMLASAIAITLGFAYKISTTFHFLLFTYIELLDKTYYLNHYYFVSLMCFILIWLPANALFSLDVRFRWANKTSIIPKWIIELIKWQLGIVYFYAGIAKINDEWLIHAQPLTLWLSTNDHMPILGYFFRYRITAFLFSWAGMIYDISIPFLLCLRKIRPWAYLILLFFHAVTGWLFQIGVFPLVMSVSVLIFFSESFHRNLLAKLFSNKDVDNQKVYKPKTAIAYMFIVFLVIQLLIPWRYLLYPGNLFWTEEGFRFSWRVMLVEKAGVANFYVRNPITKTQGVVDNSQFLNKHQEKQMSFQPDMILQFAHFLADHYEKQMKVRPEIFAQVEVSLNGKPSQILIDPTVNLANEYENLLHKKWILPLKE